MQKVFTYDWNLAAIYRVQKLKREAVLTLKLWKFSEILRHIWYLQHI